MINLFYHEPNPDRWFIGDHVPRAAIRRLVRGSPKPGGVKRWFLNLRAGFDKIRVPYTVNNYSRLRKNEGDIACVVGKPHVIESIPKSNPILFGPGVASHPSEVTFWDTAPIELLVISCEWFRQMYVRDLPRPIPTKVWPAGIDTEGWAPTLDREPTTDFLLYDKVRWNREVLEKSLIEPIRKELRRRSFSFLELRYGFYREEDYRERLRRCSAMIFLCEHETQGFAYQQALSMNVPILAWNRGGAWMDPMFYPDRIKFGAVSSVPFWDNRCGTTFSDVSKFPEKLDEFLHRWKAGELSPREYILDNLTLEKCAAEYLQIFEEVRRTI